MILMLRCPTSILLVLMLATVGAGSNAFLVDCAGHGDFFKIQDAIDASEAGGEITVLKGTYRENLVVDRSITLLGDGRPVVEGDETIEPLIVINASGVVVDGFVFAGGSYDRSLETVECDSAAVLILSDGSKIINNTISGSPGHGIFIQNSTGHLVSANKIHDNLLAGIRLFGVNYSTIETSEVYRNAYGIFIESSQENWISKSEVWGNGADGITFAASYRNEFSSNSIHNNSENGIRLSESNNNIFVANIIRDCRNSGIDIYRSDSNMITMQTIEICNEMGINIDSSNNNVIVQNVLSDNDLNGVAIRGSSFNTVSKNLIRNNRESGISLRGESDHNLIMKNDISGNKRYGLVLDDSDLNFVQENEIRRNGDGIIIRYSSDVNVIENEIADNVFGVSLEFVHNAVVSKNQIANNTRDGIRLLRCDNGKIYGNSINNSVADGIHVLRSTGTVVSDNDIHESGEYGVQVLDESSQNLFMTNLIRDSGLGGIYIFHGELNLIMSNALIDNGKFNGRDNGGNRWIGNHYSDYACKEMIGTMIGLEPYEIQGQRGAVTFDHRPFLNYRILLGR